MAKTGPAAPTPERIARILVDAEELGDKRAAAKHHCHHRTVENYRARYAADPAIVELCGAYKAKLQDDWLRRAHEVRRKALRNLEASLAGADPRQLAVVFKVVHEGILAREVLGNKDDQLSADPEPSVEPPPEGTPEGSGAAGPGGGQGRRGVVN